MPYGLTLEFMDDAHAAAFLRRMRLRANVKRKGDSVVHRHLQGGTILEVLQSPDGGHTVYRVEHSRTGNTLFWNEVDIQ